MEEKILEMDSVVKPRVPRLDLADPSEKPKVNILKQIPPALKRPTFTYRLPATNNKKTADDQFYPGEYNFIDIGMAEDTDAFVYQANFKKLALAIKGGWTIVSRDQNCLNYIRRRIAEIEVAQGQTWWALLVEIFSNLIRYHNCFVIKARDFEASSGKIRNIDGQKLEPVAGYFVASPDTIQFKIGKDNHIKSYKHIMPDGRFKVYPAEDVIHFHIYKKPHMLAGTPAWAPVLEDILALRRIEEHVENLVYQHIYPLYQYKVGTEKFPELRFEDGLTEMDVVRAEIQDMPTDGMLITPWRHEITGLGSESRALRAETYLEYFKKRVIAGSGLSELDFGYGNTANRSTADSMSKLAIDNVKFYQANMANTINFEIIRELMLESTLNYDHSDEEVRVELQFNEIDVESQIKLQNHYMLMYQGNTVTETEMRKHMGKDPLDDGTREDTHLHRVEKQKAEWQAQADLEKVQAQAKNRQQPTNQHGKKSGPSKRKSSTSKDFVAEEFYTRLADDLKAMNKSHTNLSFVRQLFMMTSERIKTEFRNILDRAIVRGAREYPLTEKLRIQLSAIRDRVMKDAGDDIERLFGEASNKTSGQLMAGERDELAIDALKYRIRFIESTLTHKAYVLAKVAAMRANGVRFATIQCDPDGEDHETWHGVVIELSDASPESLPPFHPNCTCDLVAETDR